MPLSLVVWLLELILAARSLPIMGNFVLTTRWCPIAPTTNEYFNSSNIALKKPSANILEIIKEKFLQKSNSNVNRRKRNELTNGVHVGFAFGLVSYESSLGLHHGIDGQFLVVLRSDYGHGGLGGHSA